MSLLASSFQLQFQDMHHRENIEVLNTRKSELSKVFKFFKDYESAMSLSEKYGSAAHFQGIYQEVLNHYEACLHQYFSETSNDIDEFVDQVRDYELGGAYLGNMKPLIYQFTLFYMK